MEQRTGTSSPRWDNHAVTLSGNFPTYYTPNGSTVMKNRLVSDLSSLPHSLTLGSTFKSVPLKLQILLIGDLCFIVWFRKFTQLHRQFNH